MHALRVLEFDSVCRRLANHCETALGAESAASLAPSFETEQVWAQLEETTEAHACLSRYSIPSLGAVRDLRSAVTRAEKGGTLGAQELFEIADALHSMRAMRTALVPRRAEIPRLWPHIELLPEIPRLEDSLYGSLEPSGAVKDSASPPLAALRQKKRSTAARIVERIQSYTTGKTRDLLSDPIYTVRDGRYVVPLKAENRGKLRGIVHDSSSTGQTIFVEPEDVLQLGNALREVEVAEREEELRILAELSAKVGGAGPQVRAGIEHAADLDLILAKARLAFEVRGVLPERLPSPRIEIDGGKHPLLDPASTIPLDLSLGADASVLITGPNTGGKTVAIKAVGLFVLMAQSGLFLPAIHVRFGPFSQVWADIGDEQSIEQSLSTFSGHIKNISEALREMKPGALALLDEVGAGTDPAEGAALAQAVLLEMHRKGACVLASTHYGELKAFAYNTEGFQNAAMEFDQKTLRPTYRLLLGAPGASQALRVAERYGIPKDVIERAREGLSSEQQNVASMLEKLEQAQKLARHAQSEADRRAAELKRSEEHAAAKLAEAEDIRKNVHAKASATIEDALREIRLEAADIFEELKGALADPQSQAAARKKLKDLQEVGADFADEFERTAGRTKPTGAQPVLRKGDSVRVDGYPQTGIVLEDPKNGNAHIQVGILKMTVPVDRLETVTAKLAAKPKTNLQFQKAQTATTEIHLRMMRAEEASEQLERFIDDAVLAGLPSVRIVHGKGEGILRKVTQDYLRRHPHVASYRDGESGEGGQGVTIAVIK